MRAFADPGVDVVVLMCAAQMGKTEAVFNVLGWMWDSRPRPSILVLPTQKLAYTMSRDRIADMLRTAPGLQDKIDQRYNKPGSLERWINGARFGLAWAGSATELSSHPAAFVMVDERDRMGEDTGGEGDPVRLAQARTKNYVGSKVGVFSTPTSEGMSPIWDWWLTGSRMRWCWYCPGCGVPFAPELGHARFPEKASYETIRAEAWIECPSCEHAIRDDDVPGLRADYVPYVVDEDGQLRQALGVETRNRVASYWATGFASQFTGIGRIMEQYARAARDGGLEDVAAIVNTWAGELFKMPGEGATGDDVRQRQVDHVPDGVVQLVTAGVDVQQDSLYYVVRGWCAGTTSYLLDYGQLHGATEYDDVWLALHRVLEGPFLGLHVRFALIDSGYNTHMVYEQCRRRPSWAPAKGQAHQEKPFRDALVDEAPSGRARRTLKLWHYCSDTWKTWLYARIRWPEGEPGAWYVPAGVGDDYCAQVVNERVRVHKGRREWYRTGSRQNHYLDAEVLAAVAAHIQNVRTLRRPAAPEAPQSQPTPPHNRSGSLQRRTL